MNSHREDKDAFAIYYFLSSWHFSVQNIKYRCKSHWPQPRQDDEFENLMQRINNSFTQTKSICQQKTKVLKKKRLPFFKFSTAESSKASVHEMPKENNKSFQTSNRFGIIIKSSSPLLFCKSMAKRSHHLYKQNKLTERGSNLGVLIWEHSLGSSRSEWCWSWSCS